MLSAQKEHTGNQAKINLTQAFTELEKERDLHLAFDPDQCSKFLVLPWDKKHSNSMILENLLRSTPFKFKPQEKNHYLIFSDPVKLKELTTNNLNGFLIHLSGNIRDRETKEILPGALAIIMPDGYAVSADINGKFLLNYTTHYENPWIEFRYLGYHTQIIRSSELNKVLDINLVQNIAELPPIEIQAIRPQFNYFKVRSFQLNPQIKTAIQLNNNVFNDLIRSLHQLSGVNATEDRNMGLQIRGSNVEENLILLNGLMLFNVDHFYGVFSSINPYIVSEINLYKSYFPSIYGGRSSSVIDILSPQANREFHGGIDLNLITGNAYTYLPLGKKINLMLAGRTTSSNLGKSSTFNQIIRSKDQSQLINRGQEFDITAINPDYQFYDFYSKADYQISKKLSATASIFSSFDNLKSTYSSNLIKTQEFRGRYNDSSSWRSLAYSLGLKGQFSTHWNFDLKYGRTEFDFKYDIASRYSFRGLPANEFSSIFNKALNDNFKFNNSIEFKNTITDFGLEYNRFHTDVNLSFARNRLVNEENTGNEVSSYLQSTFLLNKKLKVSPGVRLIFFNEDLTPQFSPRISLEYNFNPKFSSTLNFGKYFQFLRQVRYEDRFGREYYLWTQTSKNQYPSLTSHQWEWTNSYKLKNLNFKIELYYKSLNGLSENIIHLIQDRNRRDSFNIKYERIEGSGRYYGIDFSIDQSLGKYSHTLIYSFNRSENSYEKINFGEYFQKPYARTHQIKLIQYLKYKKFNFSLQTVYGSPLPYNDVQLAPASASNKRIPKTITKTLDDYLRVDTDIRYNYPIQKYRLEFSFSVLNVFNQINSKYIQTLFSFKDPTAPQGHKDYTVGAEVNNLRRTLNVGVGFHF